MIKSITIKFDENGSIVVEQDVKENKLEYATLKGGNERVFVRGGGGDGGGAKPEFTEKERLAYYSDAYANAAKENKRLSLALESAIAALKTCQAYERKTMFGGEMVLTHDTIMVSKALNQAIETLRGTK